MQIRIEGANHTPSWATLQDAIRESLGDNGQLTRIARRDNGCDYRAPGEYEVDYRQTRKAGGDVVTVALTVER